MQQWAVCSFVCVVMCGRDGSTDPFCIYDAQHNSIGVSMETLVSQGAAYWKAEKSKLDYVIDVIVNAET